MKKRSFLLTLIAVVSAFAILATPAQAGGKKKHYDRGWNNGGYGYYQRGWNDYGYRRAYYRPAYRPVYYHRDPCYRPGYYAPAPVFFFGFGFR